MLLSFIVILKALLLNGILFTAVPPSANPSGKLTKACLKQISSKANITRVDSGRIWFSINNVTQLTSITARSIRIISLTNENINAKDCPQMIGDKLCKSWDPFFEALIAWKKCGNAEPKSTVTFSLTCQKWQDFVEKELSASTTSNVVAQKLRDHFDWDRVPKNYDPSYKFHLLLYGSCATLELVALDRSIRLDELPKPGFKRPESFALAKACDIQPGFTVLDPMCGRGTFLVEAATFWPDAKYIGVDRSRDQLRDAQENVKAAGVKVDFCIGDARHLSDFNDESVDRILTCPPFGIQFDTEFPDLYDDMLLEWSRLLSNTGQMVVLIDVPNLSQLKDAIEKADCCVIFTRSPFRLGRLNAAIVVAKKGICHNEIPKEGTFEWEETSGKLQGRSLWSSLREDALPNLEPYSSHNRKSVM